MLGYLVFIIPPKFCKLREFPLGDLWRNSTSPPPVLETLDGESIHFLLGICYSPPVSDCSTRTPTLFSSLGGFMSRSQDGSELPRPSVEGFGLLPFSSPPFHR
jgi:hypothetical protein